MLKLATDVISHPLFPDRDNAYLRWYPKRLTPPTDRIQWSPRAVFARGAYIHVPFCTAICRFCPFNKVQVNREQVLEFVLSVKQEARLYGDLLQPREQLGFVYFGGGSPSVLSPSEISEILTALDGAVGIGRGAEICLEVHPTHANVQYLRDLRAAGCTRISMGVQTSDDVLLAGIGATHRSRDAAVALSAAQAVFENFAVDLMYALPGQSLATWESEMRRMLSAGIPHLSCYALVDPRATVTNDQRCLEVEMASIALALAGGSGYNHYASCASGGFDVAVPGFECQYELQHWRAPQAEYLGLGSGAFGYVMGCATVNCLGLSHYAGLVKHGLLPLLSQTQVSDEESKHRYFSLGVKTLSVQFDPYHDRFEENPARYFARVFDDLLKHGLAEVTKESLQLTDVGRLYVDTCSSLFWSNEERTVHHPEEPELRRLEAIIERSRSGTEAAVAL